jgi:hypothetical protein
MPPSLQRIIGHLDPVRQGLLRTLQQIERFMERDAVLPSRGGVVTAACLRATAALTAALADPGAAAAR